MTACHRAKCIELEELNEFKPIKTERLMQALSSDYPLSYRPTLWPVLTKWPAPQAIPPFHALLISLSLSLFLSFSSPLSLFSLFFFRSVLRLFSLFVRVTYASSPSTIFPIFVRSSVVCVVLIVLSVCFFCHSVSNFFVSRQRFLILPDTWLSWALCYFHKHMKSQTQTLMDLHKDLLFNRQNWPEMLTCVFYQVL